MTSRNAVILAAFTSCLALGGARSARADNTVCDGAIFLVPDGSAQTGTLAAGETRWFKYDNKARRSYSIEVENLSPTDGAHLALVGNMHSGSCTGPFFGGFTTLRALAEPAAQDGPLNNGTGGDRQVIQPPHPGLPAEIFF